MITKNRRLGKFRISSEIINSTPWVAAFLMSQCIIVRAEQLWECGGVEYVAISRHFDEVPTGAIVPEYEWWVGSDGGIKAVKLKGKALSL